MSISSPPPRVVRRRIVAWSLYDWANSSFATTVMAAILPVYYSKVAAVTLDAAQATQYWSLGLSLSLLLTALLAPVLGVVSDLSRCKKAFLAAFASLGIVATGALFFVEEGDWLLASLVFVVARVGFASANVFYDSLLPHVAPPHLRDRVSARGYALGYLGGGLLLGINIGMLGIFPATLGPRLCFVSVALWWGAFSLPLLLAVPEPHTEAASVGSWGQVIATSFRRLGSTLREVRQQRQLFAFLCAFFVYNDGIGTIIGVATIYGAELGFGTMELVLALLLVQLVGIPFTLLFGRLPGGGGPLGGPLLFFVLYNIAALPLAGGVLARVWPASVVGGGAAHGSALGSIIGALVAVEVIGVVAAFFGGRVMASAARRLTTKGALLLTLLGYGVVATWGFFLRTVIEFWFLAWLVAVVQGGSQALSRSLYATLTPPERSGAFFGLFGVMQKFSAILGPALFALAAGIFGSSRPAILGLVLFFGLGAWLLWRVDVAAGVRALQGGLAPSDPYGREDASQVR